MTSRLTVRIVGRNSDGVRWDMVQTAILFLSKSHGEDLYCRVFGE